MSPIASQPSDHSPTDASLPPHDSSNILYPIADDANDTLNFSCRTCGATAPAASSCVYHHDLDIAAHDTAGVTQDVASDPTVRTDPTDLVLTRAAPFAGAQGKYSADTFPPSPRNSYLERTGDVRHARKTKRSTSSHSNGRKIPAW